MNNMLGGTSAANLPVAGRWTIHALKTSAAIPIQKGGFITNIY
ncbi:hypothetical protein [Spirosoma pomorum]